jgi:hypothetical protein
MQSFWAWRSAAVSAAVPAVALNKMFRSLMQVL